VTNARDRWVDGLGFASAGGPQREKATHGQCPSRSHKRALIISGTRQERGVVSTGQLTDCHRVGRMEALQVITFLDERVGQLVLYVRMDMDTTPPSPQYYYSHLVLGVLYTCGTA